MSTYNERQRKYWKDYYHRNKDSIQMLQKYVYKYRERNKKLVMRYKRFCGCKLCGEKEPVCLDLHHLKDKDRPVATAIGSFGLDRLRQEIRKCVVLCANCHRKVHAGLSKLD